MILQQEGVGGGVWGVWGVGGELLGLESVGASKVLVAQKLFR
jgi:hypothetical protein